MTPEENEKKIFKSAKEYSMSDAKHLSLDGMASEVGFVQGARYGLKLGRAQGIRDVIDYVRLTALYGYGVAHEIEQHFAEDLKEQG